MLKEGEGEVRREGDLKKIGGCGAMLHHNKKTGGEINIRKSSDHGRATLTIPG